MNYNKKLYYGRHETRGWDGLQVLHLDGTFRAPEVAATLKQLAPLVDGGGDVGIGILSMHGFEDTCKALKVGPDADRRPCSEC
jgi:hypothetical protein